MNYKDPFPRVSGYYRVNDIMGVDSTEFRVYLNQRRIHDQPKNACKLIALVPTK